MAFPLLAMGLMAAGSSIAGALSNRSRTQTSTYTPNWSEDQQRLQHIAGIDLASKLERPGDVYAGYRVAAKDRVNRGYENTASRLKKQFAGRGFGRAGTLVTNMRQAEADRIGDLAGVDTQFAGMQEAYESELLDRAMRFGFAGNGGTQTGTTPGDMLGGGVSGGISTLTTLLTLNQLLKGGGGGRGDGIFDDAGGYLGE